MNVREDPDALLSLGVTRYPAIGSGEKVLSKLFLTRWRIRRFLKEISGG